MIRRKLYSYVEPEERLYSTGNDELDYLLEKAFCDGYEYAQREFSEDEDGMSTAAKIGIGAGATALALAGGAYAGKKGLLGKKVKGIVDSGIDSAVKGYNSAKRSINDNYAEKVKKEFYLDKSKLKNADSAVLNPKDAKVVNMVEDSVKEEGPKTRRVLISELRKGKAVNNKLERKIKEIMEDRGISYEKAMEVVKNKFKGLLNK